jgi:2-keto-4-pentenoate hydratase/2-oxohepta-3-ene-1,7-dioic acid hydratase in catechol pathway
MGLGQAIPGAGGTLPTVKLCRFVLHAEPQTPRSGLYYEGRFYETDGEKAIGIHDTESAALLAPIILAPSVRVHETQPSGEGGVNWGYHFNNPTRMVGSNSEVELPEEMGALDVEARIALVISGRGQYVRPEEAHEFILGYAPTLFFRLPDEAESASAHGLPPSAANDVFWALGPVLTTPDELIENLGESLTDYSWQYRLRINGETLSEAETLQGPYGEALALASRFGPLMPGEVFAGPTLAHARGGGQSVRAGDTIELEVQKLGRLVVRLV